MLLILRLNLDTPDISFLELIAIDKNKNDSPLWANRTYSFADLGTMLEHFCVMETLRFTF